MRWISQTSPRPGTNERSEGARGQVRLLLTMSNQPDGTAIGSMVALDEGRLEIPVSITQAASNLTIRLTAVGGWYTGVLNQEGTKFTGTYTEGNLTAPLTFRRAAIGGPR
jgi:hypothetical protein